MQHFNFGHIHQFIAEADDVNVFEDIMDVVHLAEASAKAEKNLNKTGLPSLNNIY